MRGIGKKNSPLKTELRRQSLVWEFTTGGGRRFFLNLGGRERVCLENSIGKVSNKRKGG